MILAFINTVLVIWIYFYLVKLKRIGCKCSITPQYYFIAFYIIVSIIYMFITSMISIYPQYIKLFMIISIFYCILTFAFVYNTFMFIQNIEKENCKCADTVSADILEILAWIRSIALIIALLAIIIELYSQFSLNNDNKDFTLVHT